MQPQDSGIKTWQWVVTVIVIIVLIVIGFMVFSGKGSSAPATTIVISDQYPGNVVYVSSVQLVAAGWVVIHSDNNGQPGPIIGEVYVPAGINPAKVTVTSPIIDGGTYYAVLNSDNGDQKFDPTVDVPLTDTNGNTIMRVFHGSVSAGNNIKG
jgi:hypothetical protein